MERTLPEFVFNIKAYHLFTRHQTPITSLVQQIQYLAMQQMMMDQMMWHQYWMGQPQGPAK